ncbi:MAG: VacJ family lipoprotein [Betaproteobacteria bacterium]|nr:VacJ family lipoprotein [Betaproteobacteria bacterium]
MVARFLIPLLLTACMLCGCAAGPDPRDPLEPFNRKVYAFNEGVDKAVLKPVAKGYVAVVPKLARRGVSNFFNNLGMVVTTLNDALQVKGSKVPVDFARFTTNIVFGLGGLIDVATELKIENRNEDFGQTLGYWGVASGPYLVLPLFGPSSARDGPGLAVDFVASPLFYWNPEADVRWGLFALDVVDTRANLLEAEKFLETAAIDRYSFLRDSYLQRREYLIHDGNPPTGHGARQKSLKELEEEDMMDDPVPLRAAPRVRRP